MNLYDGMMERLRILTRDMSFRSYGYAENKIWPEDAELQMIFQSDTAFELGGGKAPSANLTCVTSNPDFFDGDQILVYGPELHEITGQAGYVRVCEVLVRDDFSDECQPEKTNAMLYKLVQDMDFVKYHIYTKGFMLRSAGQSCKEQVRVGKQALRDGISFERIGDTFISHYKKLAPVLAVRISFITAGTDYEKWLKEAKLAADIRNSLSAMQKGLPKDCGNCSIREICNEVEGLRELHFGKKEV